ncbi:MAG: PEP-CTERM sorting domain-containing protein [Planctomycetes bacterium]|nr:PEP-CTERM sorting domain-containing protein [Planctomycetota bacterium]
MISRVVGARCWKVAFLILAAASPASASFHLWQFSELYTNADGSVQFIELTTSFDAQQFTAGQRIRASSGPTLRDFVFPGNTPAPTGNHRLLLATAPFAALPGAVAPDFILPNGFLFQPSGIVNFIGAESLSYTSLPADGILSLSRNQTTGTNSPTNYAGQVGSIVPEPASVLLGAMALVATAACRRRRRATR